MRRRLFIGVLLGAIVVASGVISTGACAVARSRQRAPAAQPAHPDTVEVTTLVPNTNLESVMAGEDSFGPLTDDRVHADRGAALLSAMHQGPVEGSIILFIVIVNVVLGSWQEYGRRRCR